MLAINYVIVNNKDMEANGTTETNEPVSPINLDALIDLGRLSLQFSRVERVTTHEDGERKETDSDHTVMLAVLSCSIAPQIRPDLDLGLIAQYAIHHDLVEVYAGDTVTIGVAAVDQKEKQRAEAEALLRITDEFSDYFPNLPEIIRRYEKLDTTEARFVKGIDKLMPIIAHFLNDGKMFKENGTTDIGLFRIYERQTKDMEQYLFDLPEVLALRVELV